MSLTAPELRARLLLRALPGPRDAAINRLVAEHGTAAAALRDHAALLAAGAKVLPDATIEARIAAVTASLARNHIAVLTPDDPAYPRRLVHRLQGATPPLLFVMGDVALLRDAGVAIVGSRAMSEYGRMVAEDLARDLARLGLCIISGLARGIDAAAHRAAIDAGGSTIAVLGNGVDVIYPPSNRRLRDDIVRYGALVSQYLPGVRPAPWHFPERNLLLAALSAGVVVAEAGARSGATITAHHAADLNVYAMSVPGPIGRPGSVGTNQLLREGAVCVTSAADILETIDGAGLSDRLERQRVRNRERRTKADAADGASRRGDLAVGLAGDGAVDLAVDLAGDRAGDRAQGGEDERSGFPDLNAVQRVLSSEARHVDDIAITSGLPAGRTLAALMQLELAGAVRQHPGARFALR